MTWAIKRLVWIHLTVVFTTTSSLSAKWTDTLVAKNRAGKDAHFNHPFLQACAAFLSEIICYIVYKIQMCWDKRNKKSEIIPISYQRWNPIIFLGPTLCDILGSSLMYIGLNLTYVSSFQMLKGSTIVFTGLLSIAFLGRRFKLNEWLGFFVLIGGLVCAGMADIISPTESDNFSSNDIITGDVLIIFSMFLSAAQGVLEEKFLVKYDVPVLQGVGWEGLFGFAILSLLLIPMYFIKVGNSIFDNPGGRMEDAYDGFVQMYNNPLIIVATAGLITSGAVQTYADLSLVKEMSLANKLVLDNLTTLIVWIVSLSIGWRKYHYLQLVAFLILLCGMCIYYDLLFRPLYTQLRNKCGQKSETDPLFESSDEELASTHIYIT